MTRRRTKGRIAELEATLKETTRRYDDAATLLSQAREDKRLSDIEVNRARVDIENANAQLTDLANQVTEWRRCAEDRGAIVGELRAQLDDAAEENAQLTEELRSTSIVRDEFEGDWRRCEQRLTNAERDLDSARELIATLLALGDRFRARAVKSLRPMKPGDRLARDWRDATEGLRDEPTTTEVAS